VALCSLVVGLSACAPAAAQVVTVNYERTYGFADNRAIIQLDTNIGGPYDGLVDREFDLYIGSQNLTFASLLPSPTIGYCADPLGALGQDPIIPFQATIRSTSEMTSANPGPFSNGVRGAGAAWLFNNTVVNDNRDSAALQLAIWEALYDWNGAVFANLAGGNIDLDAASDPITGDNRFRFKHTPAIGTVNPNTEADAAITADIRNRANNFLLTWGGQLSDATWLDTNDETVDGQIRQDLITVRAAAPEPGTLALLALPLLGAAVRRYRRQNR
jgi:hypothetical protein